MDEQIKKVFERAQKNELKAEIGYSGPDTKYVYHFAVTEPETGRVFVGTGTPSSGPDYSWGFEVEPSKLDQYL